MTIFQLRRRVRGVRNNGEDFDAMDDEDEENGKKGGKTVRSKDSSNRNTITLINSQAETFEDYLTSFSFVDLFLWAHRELNDMFNELP